MLGMKKMKKRKICVVTGTRAEYGLLSGLMKKIDHTLRFYNVPHAAEKVIYKDYGMPKKYDILLAGAVATKSLLGDHYPLRIRLARDILPKMVNKYKCTYLN